MTPEGKVGDLKPVTLESGVHTFVRLLEWNDQTRILKVRVEDRTSPLNGKIITMELQGWDKPSN